MRSKEPTGGKKICPKCNRQYKRRYCEYCKREEKFDINNYLNYFTPRLRKDIMEIEPRLSTNELNYLVEGGSLLITGVVGSGKTVYASHLMMELMKKSYIEHVGPSEFKIISVVDLLSQIRDSYKSEVEMDLSVYFNNNSLIVLDDLGAEKETDWTIEKLYQIINYRYEYILPTIFTTNLSSDELSNSLGSRIVSRINQMALIKKMKKIDYRINGTN